MKEMILEKQVGGRWKPGKEEPSGHVMYLHIETLQRLMREHCQNHNSIVGGLREDEEIVGIMYSPNGDIKISIKSTGD